jgi:hypothetical protein
VLLALVSIFLGGCGLDHGGHTSGDLIGEWGAHQAVLKIGASRNGTERVWDVACLGEGRGCSTTYTLVLMFSGREVTARVTGISYTDDAGRAIADPYPAHEVVGSVFRLGLVAPHQLHETILRGQGSGFEYWCQPGVASQLQSRCGA